LRLSLARIGFNLILAYFFIMWNKIKQFFIDLFSSYESLEYIPNKTLETLDILDDVYVERDNEILCGWIWEINKKSIYVILSNLETITIHYKRPLTQSIIKDENVTLYLNNPYGRDLRST